MYFRCKEQNRSCTLLKSETTHFLVQTQIQVDTDANTDRGTDTDTDRHRYT
jgi:hypothetical protein